jgi:hypothetical protein
VGRFDLRNKRSTTNGVAIEVSHVAKGR